MNLPSNDRLNKLKQKLLNKQNKVTINTEFFILAKELGCLPELIGREYEVTAYDKEGRVKTFRQKPMAISSFISLMKELQLYRKEEEKAYKKAQGRRR